MSECPICQHPKIQAINAALDGNRSPNLVRAQFRLNDKSWAVHMAHRLASEKVLDDSMTRHDLPDKSLTVHEELKPVKVPVTITFIDPDTGNPLIPEMPRPETAELLVGRPSDQYKPVECPLQFVDMDGIEDPLRSDEPETSIDAIQPAIPHVRRAARLVKTRLEYEQLIATINDVLQSENMGL